MKPTTEERAAIREELRATQEAQLRELWSDVTLTGRIIADKMGISYFILKRLLSEYGLPSRSCGRIQGTADPLVRNAEWLDNLYPGMRLLLGAVPDRVVATDFKISRQRVVQIRKELGIASFGALRSPTRAAMASP